MLLLATIYTVPNLLLTKCAESKNLLSSLVDVAGVDLQVAFTLLRMCGGFCKMVHITRVTPPSLASDALVSFDEDVRQCFVLSSAIQVSDTAWKQAQLSLRFGVLRPSFSLMPCCCCLHFLTFFIRPGQNCTICTPLITQSRLSLSLLLPFLRESFPARLMRSNSSLY